MDKYFPFFGKENNYFTIIQFILYLVIIHGDIHIHNNYVLGIITIS